jgi:hypothetical protein
MTTVDAVGNTIKEGDLCMHVRKSGNTPILMRVKVEQIKSNNSIGIRTGNNAKLGWTFSEKLMKIIKEKD